MDAHQFKSQNIVNTNSHRIKALDKNEVAKEDLSPEFDQLAKIETIKTHLRVLTSLIANYEHGPEYVSQVRLEMEAISSKMLIFKNESRLAYTSLD